MSQILIVEDHPIVSESLKRLIKDNGMNYDCTIAVNASKGFACLNNKKFDLIILDINLPDMSGIEFCRAARIKYPVLKILAVTTLAQRHIAEKMLQAGANGFILKTSDSSDILLGINHVLTKDTFFAGKGVQELFKGISPEPNDLPMITRRESEILKLIADGLTNQEIADQLFISTSTVDTHRKNMLLKFNAKNTASLIRLAVSNGLIDPC